MRKLIFQMLFLLIGLSSFAQNTFRIASGTSVVVSGTPSVVYGGGTFINDGTYTDGSGTFKANTETGYLFEGTGTTNLYNASFANSDFSNLVTIKNEAVIEAGIVSARLNKLALAENASLIKNGELTGTVSGLVTKASVLTGATVYTSDLSTNISGTDVNYQWQSSTDNTDWVNVDGQTSATYTATVNANVYYRCKISQMNIMLGYGQFTASKFLEYTGAPACVTPTAFTVTGGGNNCPEATATTVVRLNGSEVGVNYQLYKLLGINNDPEGSPVAGTGEEISFGVQTTGTYSVLATRVIGECENTMTGQVNVTSLKAYTFSGCENINGTYLQVGPTSYSTGTNAAFYDGRGSRWVISVEGTFYAQNPSTNSEILPLTGWVGIGFNLCDEATITVTDDCAPACVTPTAYNVTGSGSYCYGGTGVTVGLSNSETGVTYQLKKDGNNVGESVTGTTGNTITFGLQTAGTYTVLATRTIGGCTDDMTGSAIVTEKAQILLEGVPTEQTLCAGSTVADLVTMSEKKQATGRNEEPEELIKKYFWYATQSSETPLASTTVLTVGTYYLEATYDGCSSTRVAVNVTLNAIPTTKIQVSQCDVTLAAFNTPINAKSVPNAEGYRFEVTNTTDNSVRHYDNTSRYFLLTRLEGGTTYNTTYSVKVAVKMCTSVYGEYGDACLVSTPSSPGSKVQESQCGTRIAAVDTPIIPDAITGAQGYKFEIKNLTDNSVREFENPGRYLNLTRVPGGTTYNTTYAIRVATKFNNKFGDYGAVCEVSTPKSPPSKVQESQCDKTLEKLSTPIIPDAVAGTQGYQFEVTYIENGETVVREFPTTTRYLILTRTDLGVKYNKTYSIRVASKFNNSYGDYGTPCRVTTPEIPPVTKIIESQCDGSLATLDERISAIKVDGIQGYEFEITNLTTDVVHTYQTTSYAFRLTRVPGGATYSTTYAIRVKTKFEDEYGDFGDACTVTTPSEETSRMATTETDDEQEIAKTTTVLKAYPNPFSNLFKLDYTPLTVGKVTISVYDMTGKQIETRTFEATQTSNQEFGNSYATGIYMMKIAQGSDVQNIRIVKQ